jgi:hypothetical protein
MSDKSGLRMELQNLLSDKRSRIIKKWREVVFSTYPDDTQRFLRKEKSQFANPVGHIIAKDIEIIYDELVRDGDHKKIATCLDNIIRIRAIQDFKPSQAISFVLQLKDLIRQELSKSVPVGGLLDKLLSLERRIDGLALTAFDIYSECRQKINDIRVNEVRNHVGRLLKRANITIDLSEHEADLPPKPSNQTSLK